MPGSSVGHWRRGRGAHRRHEPEVGRRGRGCGQAREGGGGRCGRGEAIERIGGDEPVEPGGHISRKVGAQRTNRRDRLGRDFPEELEGARGRQRRPAGEHLVERGAEAVEIARRSGFVAEGDFRREVGERAEERARGGEGVVPIGAAGEAEIGELVGAGGGAGRGEEDVCRLDVAVDDPRSVGRGKPVEDLQRAVDHGRRRERSPPLHHLLDARARHELHRQERWPGGRVELIDLDDVRGGKRRGGAGLFSEAGKRPRILPR